MENMPKQSYNRIFLSLCYYSILKLQTQNILFFKRILRRLEHILFYYTFLLCFQENTVEIFIHQIFRRI